MNNILNILPKEFIEQINNTLKDEADLYYKSFEQASQKAVHVNTKRMDSNILPTYMSGLSFEKISYCSNGYYDNSDCKIGYNPLSHAGVIYSQDPAAMMPVSSIAHLIKPNYKVLDMCSAPGGKASQVAMLLDDYEGFLIANEINPSRNKILCSNIERMGYKNVVITKLDPSMLAEQYPEYFDLVIVDAPCSGEGMFRKYPESISEWSLENVNLCMNRQKEILINACNCLKPGGLLLYSTCTYSKAEDDDIVTWLIKNYKYNLIKPDEIILKNTKSYNYIEARTFYPHIAPGEGQFLCALIKPGINALNNKKELSSLGKIKKLSKSEIQIILSETKSFVTLDEDMLYKYSDKILYITNPNIRIPHNGITSAFVTIGSLAKNRFTPEHGLFHCLGNNFINCLNLHISDDRILNYLHGEEISDNTVQKGYGVITIDGIPIGGFKASNGKLKNHYPKGLRNNN